MFQRSAAHRHIEEALGDDPRLALVAVRRLLQDDVPWLERRAVREARLRGYQWARIGRLLQRSRQAVRQRYGAIDGTREPVVMPAVRESESAMSQLYAARADERRRAELRELEDRIEHGGEGEVVPW